MPLPLAATTARCELELDAPPLRPHLSWGNPVVGDFNRDGKPDVVSTQPVVTQTPSTLADIRLLPGLGNGRFGAAVDAFGGDPLPGRAIASGDLDGDGALDLLMLGFADGFSVLALNVALGRGDGTFSAPVQTLLSLEERFEHGNSLVPPLVRDLDGDGAPEVVVAQDGMLFGLRHTGGGQLEVAITHLGVPPGHLVSGDFDGDSREDLLVVNVLPMLFRNQGALEFTSEFVGHVGGVGGVGGDARSAVAADFTGDGHPDLAVSMNTSTETQVRLMVNDGRGQLAAPVTLFQHRRYTSSEPISGLLVVADVESDGTPDLLYVVEGENQVAVLHGRGNGTFTLENPWNGDVRSIVGVADFDGSGGLDLLTSSGSGLVVTRDFSRPTMPAFGSVPVTADFDGDGWDDVASVAPDRGLQVHLTRAEGGPLHAGISEAPAGIWKLVPGRFDAGPTVDLLALTAVGTVAPARTMVLLRGKGDGTFTAPEALTPGVSPHGVAAGDVDDDGDLDIVCACARPVGPTSLRELHLLRNAGDGTFAPAEVLSEPSTGFELAMGDLNGDGRADLVALDSGVATPTSDAYPDFGITRYQARADGTLAWVEVRYHGPCKAKSLLLEDLDDDQHLDVTVACDASNDRPTLQPGGMYRVPDPSGPPPTRFPAGYTSFGTDTTRLAAADLDGDGKKEVIASLTSDLRPSLIRQGNPGVCVVRPDSLPACFSVPNRPDRVAVLDVDHDGVPEVLAGRAPPVESLLLRQR
ncbi:FG-GAP repeat domain-containing protein [Pyxidicoccus sp. 3LFB2]